ncbi:hypothetical protein [Variovorax soli]|uniref:Transposase zinc-ribbon domain-containing protein n=1 Tax=Variovorax soli TaxID=376815 RepID=A0ABU1NFQ4_9BURK|nr:hypothetical protein [Variovorax soli]MDR6537287.1 hypothetical protein [Variovorax soli]
MARGGLRWGAGRPAHRAKAEHLLRLDVRDLNRRRLLKPGNQFAWTWRRGSEVTGTISIRVDNRDRLSLLYSIGGDQNRREASQFVRIEPTSCGFGGSRTWFACPVCSRRIAVLYMRSGRFACRTCQRVAYSSQSEDWIGRVWRRQAGLERHLGENWTRPKGMHQTTHDRLIQAILDCEEQRDRAMALFVQRHGLADLLR